MKQWIRRASLAFVLACFLTMVAGSDDSSERLSCATSVSDASELEYHSYESMLVDLRRHEKNHPELCQLHDLGVSSDGETRMWAVKLSDSVERDEDEPVVLLTGAIHGNERPTVEMALYTIDQLLRNRETHAKLLDNTQIWVIPMMNPAGHNRDSRMNANRIDLNRGFPADYNSPSLNGCEPETVNLINNFFRKHDHVVAGIDLHTYGEVYLSPWARTLNEPADWLAMSDLGRKMAKESGYRFLPLNKFIRRTVQGGGADYRYGAHGTFYYGLELGRSHAPPASTLRELCERNLDGVLLMMNRVHHSTLTGHVTKHGKPAEVTVTVEGIDTPQNIRVPYRSDKMFGRYYRLLLPGKYTVTYAPDHGKPIRKDVEIHNDSQTTVDIDLSVREEGRANQDRHQRQTAIPRYDWPCYQMDNQRSGFTPEVIRAPLAPDWSLQLPLAPHRAWIGIDTRMRWDACYSPVIAQGRVFFGSSSDDCICALDIESGRTVWRFFTGGPVRFAPFVSGDLLYAVSDDGYLYCLSTQDGSVKWKFRGGPEESMILGNDRLISRWPARGAPIVSEGVVYFGCGIWPTDGIYVHALDAKTGKPIWCNDTSGNIYMAQPHNGADAFSGISAQGYFAEMGNRLLVATGRAVPAFLDKRNGTLIDFRLAPNQESGGGRLSVMPELDAFWTGGDAFRATGVKSGMLAGANEHAVTPDGVVFGNVGHKADRKLHRTTYRSGTAPDKRGNPMPTLSVDSDDVITDVHDEATSFIVAGKHAVAGYEGKIIVYDLAGKEPNREYTVEGTVYGLAYAHGRLVASTDRGEILCFRSGGNRQQFRQVGLEAEPVASNFAPEGKQPALGRVSGYTLVLGGNNLKAIEALVVPRSRHVVVIDEREQTIDALRKRFLSRGLYGPHISALVGKMKQTPLPNRFASLIVDNGEGTPRSEVQRLLTPRTGRYQSSPSATPVNIKSQLDGEGTWTHACHDPANTLCSSDSVVKGPLATRWFRDLDLIMPNREGRSNPPLYLDGRMYVEGIDSLVCVDAYSGAELWRLTLPGVQEHMDQSHYSGSSTGGNMCLDEKHIYLVQNRPSASCSVE